MRPLTLLLLLFICGCATKATVSDRVYALSHPIGVHPGNYYDMPAASAAPERIEVTGGSVKVLAQDFLTPDSQPKNPYFAYVYFPHRPIDAKEEQVYKNVCKHWWALVPKQSELKGIPAKNLVSFYWFLDNEKIPAATLNADKVCDYLVEHYNYSLARSARELMAFKDTVQLVYYDQNNGTFIYFNLERLEPASYKNAFYLWRDKVLTLQGVQELKLYNLNAMFRRVAMAYFRIPVHLISTSLTN